jgi:hypothetical protein
VPDGPRDGHPTSDDPLGAATACESRAPRQDPIVDASHNCCSAGFSTRTGQRQGLAALLLHAGPGDIRELVCRTCDRLGIEWQQNEWKQISVARRASVALLDSFVGAKA